MKLVYIQSLSRSGSTFLQQTLANTPGYVSLGEVHRVLRNQSLKRDDPYETARKSLAPGRYTERSQCSCGRERTDCDFWGPILERSYGTSLADCYREMTARFQSLFPTSTLVDSSKISGGAEDHYIANNLVEPSETRIIFLIRDFRAWCYSMQQRNEIRYRARRVPPGYYSYLADSYRWWLVNRKSLKSLERGNVPYLVVSHEKLVFDFESEMNRILSFIGGSSNDSAAASQLQMHELFGSQSFSEAREVIAPNYDPKWLSDPSPTTYGPLLFPATRFNQRVHCELSRAA